MPCDKIEFDISNRDTNPQILFAAPGLKFISINLDSLPRNEGSRDLCPHLVYNLRLLLLDFWSWYPLRCRQSRCNQAVRLVKLAKIFAQYQTPSFRWPAGAFFDRLRHLPVDQEPVRFCRCWKRSLFGPLSNLRTAEYGQLKYYLLNL